MDSRKPEPDPGWKRFDEIWDRLRGGLEASGAAPFLALATWRKAARQAACWAWSVAWRAVCWALWLTFLTELRKLSAPPLLDIVPLFEGLLALMLCVWVVLLGFGDWRMPLDEDVSRW